MTRCDNCKRPLSPIYMRILSDLERSGLMERKDQKIQCCFCYSDKPIYNPLTEEQKDMIKQALPYLNENSIDKNFTFMISTEGHIKIVPLFAGG